ncbi:MAG TPA: STAS domain-containing protein [Candidatus Limnocylindria bacterium]|nr:STAS domain-containing protein [Candidatus Limnocylindria bacterium]
MTDLVRCDARAVAHPDATTVDALARLALELRRVGCRLVLVNPSAELRELVAFMGLTDELGIAEDA